MQHTYGMLMDACASAGDLTGCQKVLDSLAADGLAPNLVIWNAFLTARLFSPRDGLEVRHRHLPISAAQARAVELTEV